MQSKRSTPPPTMPAVALPAVGCASPRPSRSTYRPVVLVVDDDPDVRELLREYLQLAGAEPVTAANVREARAVLGGLVVDVVVTDYAMPDEDGLSLLRGIAERSDRTIGCVLMTGHEPRAALEEMARSLGASFAAKPFSLEQLVQTIEETLPSSSAARWPAFRGEAANGPSDS